MLSDFYRDSKKRLTPVFLKNISGARSYLKTVFDEAQWPENRSQLVLFALDGLHRQKAIRSLADVEAAIYKIEGRGFDFSAAKSMRLKLYRFLDPRFQHSPEGPYPQGKEANIALMKQILGMR